MKQGIAIGILIGIVIAIGIQVKIGGSYESRMEALEDRKTVEVEVEPTVPAINNHSHDRKGLVICGD